VTERPKKPPESGHSAPPTVGSPSLPSSHSDLKASQPEIKALSQPPSRPSRPSRPSFISYPEVHWEEEETGVNTPAQGLPVAPALQMNERALLLLLTGTNAGQVFAIEDRETLIGRARDAQVRVEDVGISRRHSRIVRREDGRFFVEDLRSTNGTFVNGERGDRIELRPGDRIQVGPNVVLRFSLIDETEESLARQLFEASTRDPLTRAYNRRYFVERLQAELAFAQRHRARLSVIAFDLDHFKSINDTYGHPFGDAVLKVVSAQVLRLIRTEDVFARFGGEEFLVLVRGIEHANVALVAERIRRSIDRLQIPFDGRDVRVSISVGVASLSECSDAGDETEGGAELLKLADERLYKAKAGGRNRVCAS